MTWAKLDDGFWTHPKVVAAGNTAAGVFARMLSHCGQHGTDGLVLVHYARFIEGDDDGAIEALERAGLVERLETGSVLIHDFLEHNPSREEIAARRAAEHASQRPARRTAASRARAREGAPAALRSPARALIAPGTRPDPTRPGPALDPARGPFTDREEGQGTATSTSRSAVRASVADARDSERVIA